MKLAAYRQRSADSKMDGFGIEGWECPGVPKADRTNTRIREQLAINRAGTKKLCFCL